MVLSCVESVENEAAFNWVEPLSTTASVVVEIDGDETTGQPTLDPPEEQADNTRAMLPARVAKIRNEFTILSPPLIIFIIRISTGT